MCAAELLLKKYVPLISLPRFPMNFSFFFASGIFLSIQECLGRGIFYYTEVFYTLHSWLFEVLYCYLDLY